MVILHALHINTFGSNTGFSFRHYLVIERKVSICFSYCKIHIIRKCYICLTPSIFQVITIRKLFNIAFNFCPYLAHLSCMRNFTFFIRNNGNGNAHNRKFCIYPFSVSTGYAIIRQILLAIKGFDIFIKILNNCAA